MEKLKLSEINGDVEVSIEETSTVYTVAELKREILELGEPHHLSDNWSTISRQHWNPSASDMIENYIEQECDDMYENWDERAIEQLQTENAEMVDLLIDVSNEVKKGNYEYAWKKAVAYVEDIDFETLMKIDYLETQ